MTRPHGEMPAEGHVRRMLALGLEYRSDDREPLYHRWHMVGFPVGIVYASHMPMPWGVYWGYGRTVEAFAWVRELDAALQLLDALAKRT